MTKTVSPAARKALAEIGRLGGLKGGKARARKMTRAQRIESARKAGKASARKRALARRRGGGR